MEAMHSRVEWLAFLTMAMACSSTLSERASTIRWVDQPDQIAGCTQLGIVEGSSTQTGTANIATGRNNARNEALEKAAKKGATHVRWVSYDEAFSGIHITGQVFDCKDRDRGVGVASASQKRDDGPEQHAAAAEGKSARRLADQAGDQRDQRQDGKTKAGPPTDATPTISTGSCFFVSSSGLALSSLHVVADRKKIFVVDTNGKRASASILAKDEQLDLVALQVDREDAPQVLALAEKEAGLGDSVFTIGFPEVVDLGFDPKLTEGSISGERGLGLDFLLQVSTPVHPGNSGGALVNEKGYVVGIVALRQNYFSDGASAENTAFAVKATSIRKAFRSLAMSSAKPTKARGDAIKRARSAACLVLAADEDLPARR
jgi:S1-C subfamily serine protease